MPDTRLFYMFTVLSADALPVCLATGLFLLLIFALAWLLRRRNETKVLASSPLLQELFELNRVYQGFSPVNLHFVFQDQIQPKSRFDRTACIDRIAWYIRTDHKNVKTALGASRDLAAVYDRYARACRALAEQAFPPTDLPDLFLESYGRVERRLFRRHLLPCVNRVTARCTLVYLTPAGLRTYRKSASYSTEQLLYIRRALDTKGFLQDQAQAERAKVTAGLRYDVMARDGFRCRICGADSLSGATLHVDHIRPVSKGGLTVMDNLQTLCAACNLGKGSKYDIRDSQSPGD